jgi:predicted ribosome quality control (RQC) complex YloA/Tae2 family protein
VEVQSYLGLTNGRQWTPSRITKISQKKEDGLGGDADNKKSQRVLVVSKHAQRVQIKAQEPLHLVVRAQTIPVLTRRLCLLHLAAPWDTAACPATTT